jgi:endonuclease/exonuclease/phosphatase family metal-dependent hydrolase
MSDVFRIMSFNVNGPSGQGPNVWSKRAALHVEIINRYSPDLIGLQEVAKRNLVTYQKQLTEYNHVVGNCYGDSPPQTWTSVFWKASRFQLLESGEFWFSDTPDIESCGWGVPYPLGATWVKLRCAQTGVQLVHLNTHFEDGSDGERSRIEASKLIISRLVQLAPDLPAIVTGDFNCNPWSQPYRLFVDNGFTDTYRAAGHADSVDSSTFHDYKGQQYFALDYGNEVFWRVDWILTRAGTQPIQTTSNTTVYDARPPIYPSDHYPLVSEVRLL